MPTLRVGSITAPIESCAPAPEGTPGRFICTYEMPEPDDASTGNQDLQVSVSLRDAAQNTIEHLIETIRYSPAPPSTFTHNNPDQYYTVESCYFYVEIATTEGVLDTLEIVLSEDAGLSCESDSADFIDTTFTASARGFVCECTPEVLRGGHPLSIVARDFFGRSVDVDLELTIYTDPQAPTIMGPAELNAFQLGIAQQSAPMFGPVTETLLLTEGTTLSLPSLWQTSVR